MALLQYKISSCKLHPFTTYLVSDKSKRKKMYIKQLYSANRSPAKALSACLAVNSEFTFPVFTCVRTLTAGICEEIRTYLSHKAGLKIIYKA